MTIHYVCRHCDVQVGTLNQNDCSAEGLGFHQLTQEERQSMIEYKQDGTITVKTICEDCHDAMERTPSYHELDTFIQ
ncbi:anti-sigma-F factor Fin family protein [Alkalihalobacillus sp. CinArs1]|uniref:anti-sigma-F factor Fin family protein n=1 Tax=Alkalihalobacillus sp. CinArs1 TaxID=2995314 RepID=UPI0022DD1465|nr:anti-sigma-F factor Fin family protein [Alkalihalobacillus sp. CinArs1]